MKKAFLSALPDDPPQELSRLLSGAKLYDSSCSNAAAVYYLKKDGGYYLKCARKGALQTEAAMANYFHAKGLGAEVLYYLSEDKDWLLTAALSGEDGTGAAYLSDPKRLCDTVAAALRRLHETDFSGCPISDRTVSYCAFVEQSHRMGQCDLSECAESLGFRSAAEAYRVFSEGKHALRQNVLLHGDYCLPNLILDRWKLSGFIDLGNGGVGDRHIDLFWGIWSLWYNLKTDRYRDRFLDAYGRDKVEPHLLKVIAAAEVFG